MVNWTANSGFVRLQTTTTGRDTDPDGYIAYTSHPDALVYNGTWVGTNGQVVLGPVAVGEHDLLLDDLAANCAVTGKNPLRITVPKGQLVRDTVSVSMEITCTAKAP